MTFCKSDLLTSNWIGYRDKEVNQIARQGAPTVLQIFAVRNAENRNDPDYSSFSQKSESQW